MKNDLARLFVAVDLDPNVRQSIVSIQEHLKVCGADIKWVEPHNIHLTLKFLENIEENKIGELRLILQHSLKDFQPFDIQINGLGSFPEKGQMRVLWIGVGSGAEKLEKIARVLDRNMETFCKEMRVEGFKPHITIGRVRSERNLPLVAQVIREKHRKVLHSQRIGKISLLRSHLTSQGPEYQKIAEITL